MSHFQNVTEHMYGSKINTIGVSQTGHYTLF